ncbi:hypothetical protein [Novosphingobium ginsenosidimutans]|uniref:Uncharacterized protein n=1 Tax=Novosphingobium ginsenosidimutans TaxID=1176536 RepID=A0A5B8S4L8_9SPHN|nr:hypothetical protein [Novosphingobium ginsenosidimutans]QEA16441.1 hypothetical protein FRF71_10030 [Novosphingobium ginsenosidimutans]
MAETSQRDIARLERLVSASDAFELLASEYDRRGKYVSWEACQRAALDTILARLIDGVLDAWTANCRIDSSLDTGAVSVESIVSPYDYFHCDTPCKIPVEFWWHFKRANPELRSADWVTGDFRFDYLDDEYSRRAGSAFSVHFDPTGLPALAVPNQSFTTGGDAAVTHQLPKPSMSGGRRPANWWPDFAEELAIYCLKEDPPEGEGTDGQSAMIEAIFKRMAERGKPEPSRSTVQPVINAILRRWRSAGN